MTTKILVVSVAFFCQFCAPVKSQPADALSFYRDAYVTVTQNYRNLLRPLLDGDDKVELDRISFSYLPTQDLVAQAYITIGGRRVIEVSFGFMAFMENLAIAYNVSGEAGRPECYYQYLSAVSEVTLDNTQRRRRGEPLLLSPFFPYYVRSGGDGCQGLTEVDLQDPEAHATVSGTMDAVLVHLLGHEVAHHILGHVDGRGPTDLDESRANETAADVWSVEHAFAMGVNPLPAFPLWSFFAAIGGDTVEQELGASHPLGIRRWADALERIVARMRAPDYAARFGEPPPEWVLQDVLRLRDLLRRLVPS